MSGAEIVLIAIPVGWAAGMGIAIMVVLRLNRRNDL